MPTVKETFEVVGTVLQSHHDGLTELLSTNHAFGRRLSAIEERIAACEEAVDKRLASIPYHEAKPDFEELALRSEELLKRRRDFSEALTNALESLNEGPHSAAAALLRQIYDNFPEFAPNPTPTTKEQ